MILFGGVQEAADLPHQPRIGKDDLRETPPVTRKPILISRRGR